MTTTDFELSARALAVAAEEVMNLLATDGTRAVGHLLDTDDNPGQRLRDAIKDVRDRIMDCHEDEPALAIRNIRSAAKAAEEALRPVAHGCCATGGIVITWSPASDQGAGTAFVVASTESRPEMAAALKGAAQISEADFAEAERF